MGRPEKVTVAALFLASADASFVNGIELLVAGGMGQIQPRHRLLPFA
jgi:NAD(P)-dependent dehydrogenase (short-subunit alcohol dehydrogenase family)